MEILCPRCQRSNISADHASCEACGFEAGFNGRILNLKTSARSEDYTEHGAETLAQIEDKHFWFAERMNLVLDVLRRAPWPAATRQMVDLGCGNGYMMQHLEAAGFNVTGVDMFIGGLEIAAKRCRGDLICGYAEDVVTASPVDAVAMFDIIEHVQNDRAFLEGTVRSVRSGGLLIVTVPAMQQLWSEYDEKGGHKRRYSAHRLKHAFTEAGVEPLLIKYFYSFAVPPVWLQRKFLHKKRTTGQRNVYIRPPSSTANALFTQMAKVERAVMRLRVPMPFGTSMIGLARVP